MSDLGTKASGEDDEQLSFVGTALAGVYIVVIVMIYRTFERFRFGLTKPGRLARRIQATTGYNDIAARFAELHLEDSRFWTKWFAATAIHSAVSIAEEMAKRLTNLQRTTLSPVLKDLETSGVISGDLSRRLQALYVKRNVVRGAGHGVGEADRTEAKRIVDEALEVTRLLLVEYERRNPTRRRGFLHGWRAIF